MGDNFIREIETTSSDDIHAAVEKLGNKTIHELEASLQDDIFGTTNGMSSDLLKRTIRTIKVQRGAIKVLSNRVKQLEEKNNE